MKRPIHVIVGVSGGLGFMVSCVVWEQFVLLCHPFFPYSSFTGKDFLISCTGTPPQTNMEHHKDTEKYCLFL